MAAKKKKVPTPEEEAALKSLAQTYEKLKEVRKSTTLVLKPSPFLRTEIADSKGNLQPFKLRYYQAQGIYHLLAMRRLVLGDAAGTGKTIEMLGALAYLWPKETDNKVIVVCPKSALRQWEGECLKFTKGVRPILVVGTPEERKAAYLDFLNAPVGPDAEKVVLLINYAILVRDWDAGSSVPLLPNGKPDPKAPVVPGLLDAITSKIPNLVVTYDECHAFKNQSTKTWQVCRYLSDRAYRCYGMSATLLKNNLMEGFAIYKCIQPSVFGTKTSFMDDYCLAPEHRVLTSDFKWVPIGDLRAGDSIIGFDEERRSPGGRRFRKSTVESHEFDTLPLFEVTLSDGTQFRATANHRWLAVFGGNRLKWLTTDQIKGKRLPRLFTPWDTDNTRDGGWLAGMFDGEGWLSGSGIHIAQNPGWVLTNIKRTLRKKGFTFKESRVKGGEKCRRLGITGKARDRARLLGQIRPERLLHKFKPEMLRRLQIAERPVVVSVVPVGVGRIVRMQTSTATFIAEGFPHHNCIVKMQPVGGGRKVPIVVGYRNLDQFRMKIDPFFLGRPKHAVSSELPTLTTKEVVCELSAAENAKYREALTGILQLGDGEVKDYEQSKAMTSLIYCQQIVDSITLLKFSEGDEIDSGMFEDVQTVKTLGAKEATLIDLLTGELEGEKVIIYTRFEKLVGRLTHLLKQNGIKSVRITGKENDSRKRAAAQAAFQDLESDTLVIIITDAGSEAINLQSASSMVFFDAPWSWGNYVQLLGRPIRIGSIHQNVVVYHLVAERPGDTAKERKTIDHYTLDLLRSKKDLVDRVLGESTVGALEFKRDDGVKELLRMMKSGV